VPECKIRIKSLFVKNALAYYGGAAILSKMCFITFTVGVDIWSLADDLHRHMRRILDGKHCIASRCVALRHVA
jgi:hypothetical protein